MHREDSLSRLGRRAKRVMWISKIDLDINQNINYNPVNPDFLGYRIKFWSLDLNLLL